jgi:hypothetical protein
MTFKDYAALSEGLNDLIHSEPGTEKSKTATQIASALWEKSNKKEPTLYLMLTHDAIKERLKRIAEDGKAAFWQHYEGHHKTCAVSRWANAGYTGAGCTCNHPIGGLNADKPTLAALDVVLEDHLTRRATHEAVRYFPLWIVDEVDFGRFMVEKSASDGDLRTLVARYPSLTNPHDGDPLDLEPVRHLTQALLDLLDEMRQGGQKRLNGQELYGRLDTVLRAGDSSLPQLVAELTPLRGHLPTGRWAKKSPAKGNQQTLRGQPSNFPRFLVPIFCEEADALRRGKHFNPRIHLLNQDKGPCLRVRWRRQVVDRGIDLKGGGVFAWEDLVVLDATADAGLLERVFSDFRNIPTPDLTDWPTNVHVHQWVDDVVYRSTLGLPHLGDPSSDQNQKARQRWYGRIADALKDFPHDWPVGIITHKPIEGEAARAMQAAGFTEVRSLHYGNERGSNTLEHVKLLVLLGLPIPPREEFKEEAQAFLHDERTLDFAWEDRTEHLEMRDRPNEPVTVGGYWKEPVASYYRQKCQAGLYQALHRIRPLIRPNDDLHIFIFTNMPIPGVKVEHLLRSEARQEIAQRGDRAVAALNSQLEQRGECTVPELAALLASEGDDVLRWVQRHALELAEATDSTFEKGGGRRPGRFVRQAQP